MLFRSVLNSLKDSKEAKAIAEALRKVWAYLDGEVIVDVDKLAKLLDPQNECKCQEFQPAF